MKRLSIIFFLLVSSAWPATFTAVASGDWQAIATWGTSGTGCHVAFPCMTDSGSAGDQVVIGNFTVTCGLLVVETCSAGSSPFNQTSLAISLTTASARLTVTNASTLIYAGPVSTVNGTIVTVNAGSKIQHDSSWATATAAISSASMPAGTATFTSASNFPAAFAVGENFVASGFTPAGYNSTWLIASGGAGTTSLTATYLGPNALGTATVNGTLQMTALYSFKVGGLSLATTNLSGTNASHVTWQGDSSLSAGAKPGACAAGVCLAGAINFVSGNCGVNTGFGTFSFVDFSSIYGLTSQSTNIAFCGGVGSASALGNIVWSNVTWNNSGTVRLSVNSATDINSIILNSVRFTNCSSLSFSDSCFRYGNLAANFGALGTYTVTGLLADGGVNAITGAADDTFASRNFFMWTGQGGGQPNITVGFPTQSSANGGIYDQMVTDNSAWTLGASQNVLVDVFLPAAMTNSVMWSDRVVNTGHLHFTKNYQASVGTTGSYSQINNFFAGLGTTDTTGASVYATTAGQSPTTATTFLFKGNIQACGYNGMGNQPFNGGYVNGTTTGNSVNTLTQDTVCNFSNQGGAQPSAGGSGTEAAVVVSGSVASLDSNLFFSMFPGGNAMTLIQSPNDPQASTSSFTFAGFNAAVNQTSYTQQLAGLNFVGTFGPDTTLPARFPVFVEPDRTVPFFDSEYLTPTGLLNTASYGATPWTSGTNYTVGQVVSLSNPGVYRGRTTYWRCITAHTASALNEPILGFDPANPFTGGNQFWELAFWQFFRTQVFNNVTFDSQCAALLFVVCPSPHTYITGLLNAWLREGYVSMETQLWTACSPNRGTTLQECGALPLAASQHIVPQISVN